MRPGHRKPQSDAVCAKATRRWYKKGVDQLKVSVSAEGAYSLVTLAGESDMNTRGTSATPWRRLRPSPPGT